MNRDTRSQDLAASVFYQSQHTKLVEFLGQLHHLSGRYLMCSAAHTKLVEFLGQLHQAIIAKSDAQELRTRLNELDAFAQGEFALEEALSRWCFEREWPSHHRQHQLFLQKLRIFVQCLAGDRDHLPDRGELYDFLTDWMLHALLEGAEEQSRPSHPR